MQFENVSTNTKQEDFADRESVRMFITQEKARKGSRATSRSAKPKKTGISADEKTKIRRRSPQHRSEPSAECSSSFCCHHEPPAVGRDGQSDGGEVSRRAESGHLRSGEGGSSMMQTLMHQPHGEEKKTYRYLCPICFRYLDSSLAINRNPLLRLLRQLHLHPLRHRHQPPYSSVTRNFQADSHQAAVLLLQD